MKMSNKTRCWNAVYLLLAMAFMSAMFALQGALLSMVIEAFHLEASSQGLASSAAFLGGTAALAATLYFRELFMF